MEHERIVGVPGRPDEALLATCARVHWNLHRARLYEEAMRRDEGMLADTGALAVRTGAYTGRSVKDKFVVREPLSDGQVWWGAVNQPLSAAQFRKLQRRVADHFHRREAFVQDLFACADPRYRLRLRLISETAWHGLFTRTLFIPPEPSLLNRFVPDFVAIHAPQFRANPAADGTRSEAFVVLDLDQRLLLIGGTGYAGEIKKGIFTALNYLLPEQGVLPMHCSANAGARGEVALFFGLSGTGKTTLAADPARSIIGDDEHGWSDRGIFNFEGGLYAKVIRLSAEDEPQIWSATNRFGTTLENVVVDPDTREVDFGDASLTENTRAAFPIDFIGNADPDGLAAHPQNIILLTADAFGVLPPVARLDYQQAIYHFLSGYTAKVAGTERGLAAEPQATFSACFAAPFLPRPPELYARMLGEKLASHKVSCWLVNTGWTGGPFGVGRRISIAYSRAIVHAILDGALADVPSSADPIFRFAVPEHCQGVPDEVLRPRQSWPDPAGYDAQARSLAQRFADNFRQFVASVSPGVAAAGPREN